MPKPKDPAAFQDLVTPMFREQKKEAHLTLTTVRSRWAEIVGPELARKCYPTRVQRGVLWIGAADASWAYQFQFMRSEIMQCLQTVLGPSDIQEVRFKAGDPRPAEEEPTAPEIEQEPIDVAPDDPLARAAEAIPDPAMRALFVRSLAKQRQSRLRREAVAGKTPGTR